MAARSSTSTSVPGIRAHGGGASATGGGVRSRTPTDPSFAYTVPRSPSLGPSEHASTSPRDLEANEAAIAQRAAGAPGSHSSMEGHLVPADVLQRHSRGPGSRSTSPFAKSCGDVSPRTASRSLLEAGHVLAPIRTSHAPAAEGMLLSLQQSATGRLLPSLTGASAHLASTGGSGGTPTKPLSVGSRLLSYIGLRKDKGAARRLSEAVEAGSAAVMVASEPRASASVQVLGDRKLEEVRVEHAASRAAQLHVDQHTAPPRRSTASTGAMVCTGEDAPLRIALVSSADASAPHSAAVLASLPLAERLETILGPPPPAFDAKAFDRAAALAEAAYAEDCEKLAESYATSTHKAVLEAFKIDAPQLQHALCADARRKRRLRTLLERLRARGAAADAIASYTQSAVTNLQAWGVDTAVPSEASTHGSGASPQPRLRRDDSGTLPLLLRSSSRDAGGGSADAPSLLVNSATAAPKRTPPTAPPPDASDKVLKLYELVNGVLATCDDELLRIDEQELPLVAAGARLRSGDESFRKIVRDVFRFPAFLGLVLFQRIVEAGMVADVEVALLMQAVRDASARVQLVESANDKRLDALRFALLGEVPDPPPTFSRAGSRSLPPLGVASPISSARPGSASTPSRAPVFPSAPESMKPTLTRTMSADRNDMDSAMNAGRGRAGSLRRTGDTPSGRDGARTATMPSTATDTTDVDLTDEAALTVSVASTEGTPAPASASDAFPPRYLGDAVAARRAVGEFGGATDPTFGGTVHQLNSLSMSWSAATSVMYDAHTGALLEHYLVPPMHIQAVHKLQAMPDNIALTRAGLGVRTKIVSPANPEEAYLRRAADRLRKQARAHICTHGVITIVDLARVWHPILERERPDAPNDLERRRGDRLALLITPSPDPLIIKLVHEMRESMRRRVSRWKHADDVDEPPARGTAGKEPAARRAATVQDPSHASTEHGTPPLRAMQHMAASVGASPSASGPKLLSTTMGTGSRGMDTMASGDGWMDMSGRSASVRTGGAAAHGSVLESIPGSQQVSALSILHSCLAELGDKLGTAAITSTPLLPCLLPGLRTRHTHRVMMEDVATLIEALVDRHPSLVEVARSPVDYQRFVSCALVSTFALLPQGTRLTGVPVWELLDSPLAAALYQCSSSYTIGTPPLSLSFYQDACADFNAAVTFTKHTDSQKAKEEQLDASRRARGLAPATSGMGGSGGSVISFGRLTSAGGGAHGGSPNARDIQVYSRQSLRGTDAMSPVGVRTAVSAGAVPPVLELRSLAPEDAFGLRDPSVETDDTATVTLAAVRNQVEITIPQQILERCFAGRPRPLMSGITGRMNFEDFVFLLTMQNDRMSRRSSQEYWFKCADLDDDGVLSPLDLECVLEAKAWSLREMHARAPNTAETMAALMDLVSPRNPYRTTLADVRRNGSSVLFFEVLLSLRPSAAARNFLGGS